MPQKQTKFRDDNKPFITSITLGGFQVFDKPTTIPLGKLTFLFGPNSAGKSAIEDGLVFILGALNNTKIGLNTGELKRHWRRVGDAYVPTLTMGLTASIPTDLRGCLDVPNKDTGSSYKAYGHEIGVKFLCQYNTEEEEICQFSHFELTVDDIPIIQMDECEGIGVNFAHPMLSGFVLLGDYQALSADLPKHLSYIDGWARIRTAVYIWLQAEKTDRAAILSEMEREAWLYEAGYSHSEAPIADWQQFAEPMRIAINEVVGFFDTIKEIALGNMTITPNIVPASRTVPSPKELTFVFPKNDSLLDLLDLLGLFADGDPRYAALAFSCLEKRRGVKDASRRGQLMDAVNRALSDHLFLERGYQIKADFRAILDFDELENLVALDFGDTADRSCLVHMFLNDSQGNKQSFDQVGSGLGYVLPILCSVASPSIRISLLQQPELHLHPALQAALGDVFIESAGDQHQIIIETHSEHLLLRILKRIRQTSQGKLSVPELLLRPDDVVVAYFDPKPDGTTSVKRLRISGDGEFIDRWPRGFFTERDGELFDE